ncbi:MAG TPA: MG2 domain-containing protein [Dokdonella sp.]|nr:MG2 domain-containing protein [Dokdonella sp.]
MRASTGSWLGWTGLLVGVACAHAGQPPRVASVMATTGRSVHVGFDQPMLTWSGSGPSQQLAFDPPYACNWYWSDDTGLECEAAVEAEPLRPATRYRLVIGAGLVSQQGNALPPQSLRFDSPVPLVDADVQWSDGPAPYVELGVNTAVTEAALRGVLTAAVHGGATEPFALSNPSGERASTSWQLRFPSTATDERVVVLRVQPGLRTEAGELAGTQDEALAQVMLGEPFRLRRAGCGSSVVYAAAGPLVLSCAAGAPVLFEFSSPPTRASLDAWRATFPPDIHLDDGPPGSFFASYDRSGPAMRTGHVVSVVAARANAHIAFEVPATLRSDGEVPLARGYATVLHTGDFATRLEPRPAQLLLPTGSRERAAMFALNSRAFTLEQREFGADLRVDLRKNPYAASPRNAPTLLPLPAPSRGVRERGGLVEGRMRSTPADFATPAYTVAYAPFNIVADMSSGHGLVWVTAWGDAAPVAAAQVELLVSARLGSALKVLARADTDADGVARMTLPEGDGRTVFVRATKDGRRAVLPLLQAMPQTANGDDGAFRATASEGDRVAWGVTDRPIYRPGDTVRYRVWVRERRANHLDPSSPAHVPLALTQWGDTVTPLPAVDLDRYGSSSGDFALPDTLRDGDYCVDLDDPEYREIRGGACFRVAAYRASDSWTELHADRDFARDGERIELTTRAGYYSGGPLVDGDIQLQSLLTPLAIEEAYPRFRAFTFIDSFADALEIGGETFADRIPEGLRTRADGVLDIPLRLENTRFEQHLAEQHVRPTPFGKLEFTATVTPSGSHLGTSASTSLRFSRFDRFVGLKLDDWLLRDAADPMLEAIVVSAGGKPLDGTPVHVRIDASPGLGDDIDAAQVPLATCELRSGVRATCAFRAPRAGLYRLTASSDGAASPKLERYAMVGGRLGAVQDAALTQLRVEVEDPGRAQIVLSQPFAKARVLFAAEHGRVLDHWVQDVEQPISRFEHPLPGSWAPGVTLRAIVLDAASDPFAAPAAGIVGVATANVRVVPVHREPSIEIASTPAEVRPGEDVTVSVRNRGTTPRRVTLAIVDDAVRALAPDLSSQSDPRSPEWLGLLERWTPTRTYGLSAWNRTVEDSARGTMPAIVFDSTRDHLETITVTGSNVRAVDAFTRADPADHSLGQPQRGGTGSTALRSRFASTAYWNDAIDLPAGTGTTVHVRLPDNLTRWRVLAWSSDERDAFELAQGTITTRLPIEVRSDLPARLFEGDTTTLAASVRNHGDAPASVVATLRAGRDPAEPRARWRATLAPNADRRIELGFRADAVGVIAVEAQAKGERAGDGTAGELEVASMRVRRRVPVAGWLPDAGVTLPLPALPPTARDVELRIDASRGLLVQEADWIAGLRDYPHRCWEQILSRAVGAVAAHRLGLAGRWPDGDAVVAEALVDAKQFQDERGLYHFFAGEDGAEVSAPSLYLTAYTVRALEFLSAAGHPPPAHIMERARGALRDAVAGNPRGWQSYGDAEIAAALAAAGPDARIGAAALERLWSARSKLDWAARADLARARAVDGGDDTGVSELREAAPAHAGRRRIAPTRGNWTFTSPALEQCKVIGALAELDHAMDARAVQLEYQRGLADLYAGGASQLDTHAAAQCLMALADLPDDTSRAPLHVEATAGTKRASLELGAGEPIASTTLEPVPRTDAALRLTVDGDASLASYVASLEYDIDGRHARRSGVGFAIDRRYSVLRGRAWKTVSPASIREGDWIRVTLALTTSALRNHVALTDVVAGGLHPTDLRLAGVAGLDLLGAAGDGSGYFSARRVDERHARFYADVVPPGTHEVHYYAQATHAGRYTALPAVAELMYGNASVANTAADTVVIAKRASPRP